VTARSVIVVALLAASAVAQARVATVTAITPTTMYIDAGTADGLAAGATWHATIAGRAATVRVVVAASHDAVVELDGPPAAVGATLELPAGLVPPAAVALRPPPIAMPPWRDPPGALDEVHALASREQPSPLVASDDTVVTGELALSAFLAADTGNTSTSWQDVALASQLAIESGAWRYDHVLEAHLAGSPEIFRAPLQNAQARFDVYLLRVAYTQGRYGASLGRQPGAPLGELGTVDGGRARIAVDRSLDVTVFAGLRPASDLALSLAPRAGADLGWHLVTADGLRAHADAGVGIDEYKGKLDRAQTAVAATVSNAQLVAHADAAVDLASDAAGKSGARVSRAGVFVRGKRARVTASASAGYDRPFYDRALASELPDLVLGPRTFAAGDLLYAIGRNIDLGTSVRASQGDGFRSGYVDTVAMWSSATGDRRASVAPFAVVGTLVDELGVRGSFDVPLAAWSIGLGGSVEHVDAGGEQAWAGLGRVSGARSFLHRWRTALSLEVAAGDGPTRLFVFGLLGYRLGR
jgi:hypothetical protein